MPTIDFSKVEEPQEFKPLPEGRYYCQLVEIEESETLNGDEMFKLRFEVLDGEYADRIIFDNLVFSKNAMKRAKLICSKLGVDVSGEVEITPELLKDRKCYVSIQVKKYESDEGKIRERNEVSFAGYERAED